jgi:hypothetical protein
LPIDDLVQHTNNHRHPTNSSVNMPQIQLIPHSWILTPAAMSKNITTLAIGDTRIAHCQGFNCISISL